MTFIANQQMKQRILIDNHDVKIFMTQISILAYHRRKYLSIQEMLTIFTDIQGGKAGELAYHASIRDFARGHLPYA